MRRGCKERKMFCDELWNTVERRQTVELASHLSYLYRKKMYCRYKRTLSGCEFMSKSMWSGYKRDMRKMGENNDYYSFQYDV